MVMQKSNYRQKKMEMEINRFLQNNNWYDNIGYANVEIQLNEQDWKKEIDRISLQKYMSENYL